jgi:hypothetical protein
MINVRDVRVRMRISAHEISLIRIEPPMEYRAAWALFFEQGVSKYEHEIQTVYEYLVGDHDDLDYVFKALQASTYGLPGDLLHGVHYRDYRQTITDYVMANYQPQHLEHA